MLNYLCVYRKQSLNTLLLLVAIVLMIGPAGASVGLAQEPAWPLYGNDLTGSRAIAGSIDSSNVSELQKIWSLQVDGPVSATPVLADGTAYVGSYDGSLYAIDANSGALFWTYATGVEVTEPNLQIPLGISGSAAVDFGVVYVGDAAATVHAVDAVTGQLIWKKQVDSQESASIWSSPIVYQGTVFVGIASIAKEAGFRGSLAALDAATGDILWQTYMVPENADGAGVFAVPVIDPSRNMIIVGTQNAYTATSGPYGNPTSVVAMDLETGVVKWAFNAPPGGGSTAPTDDVAFSASPNLFSAMINGESKYLVGEGQKSGVYWALDRETGEVVWKSQVSPSGFLGGMEGTSAASETTIVVPATDWPEFDGPASGLVVGLDSATGEILWTEKQSAPAASPASISNDVVFHAGIDGILHAYSVKDGTELWSSDLGASVSGGIGIADGIIVLGAATPQFAPMVKSGNTIVAFGLVPQMATAAASPAVVASTPLATPMPPTVTPSTPAGAVTNTPQPTSAASPVASAGSPESVGTPNE